MKKVMPKKPKVSVLMPVFNAGCFVATAIESVLSQTLQDFELICVDDGSTDNSYAILRRYARKDARVRILRNRTNKGIGYTRKRLMDLSQADFVAIMDADDAMFPDRLEKQVNYLQKHAEVVLVGGQCVTMDDSGKVTGHKLFPITHKAIYKAMYTRMAVQQPASMIDKRLVPQDFPWYDNAVSPVEDLDNQFRLLNFGTFANLSDSVLYYRVYSGSNSLRDPKRTFELTRLVRDRAVACYGYSPTLFSRLLAFAQSVVVTLLPKQVIVPIYSIIRGMRSVKYLFHFRYSLFDYSQSIRPYVVEVRAEE